MGHLTKSNRAFFVTGTDTEVGKTCISKGLLLALDKMGYSTVAYKPIAAGCENTPDGLRNEDALILQRHSNIELQYDEVNPIAFEAAIAPHLALKALAGSDDVHFIPVDKIREGFVHLLQKEPNVILVEGAGGWRLPLGGSYLGRPRYLSEFVSELNLSVILVVGMRLGCLNHAVLTAEAISNDGLKIAGWVANQVDPDMVLVDENIESLKSLLDAPFLGNVPQLSGDDHAGNYLNLGRLGLSAEI
ncbi:dethiobiotin synthase [Paraglaciecola aquimarina]|uniref:ATP-dependent dethiobiotin synthetase BioD n=1 Tax=Paraglaciecola aquimarina TaxID=1235557 RepID=A0ABU3SZL1_9ALTE|nr:dethiobiotin synthase [Paraglaciecola aquimarina]MDU0355443.1 dethiobiotin synthase [Paraglaciecola aquimarina]